MHSGDVNGTWFRQKLTAKVQRWTKGVAITARHTYFDRTRAHTQYTHTQTHVKQTVINGSNNNRPIIDHTDIYRP